MKRETIRRYEGKTVQAERTRTQVLRWEKIGGVVGDSMKMGLNRGLLGKRAKDQVRSDRTGPYRLR